MKVINKNSIIKILEKYSFYEEFEKPSYVTGSDVSDVFLSHNHLFLILIYNNGDFSIYNIDKNLVKIELFRGKFSIHNLQKYLDI